MAKLKKFGTFAGVFTPSILTILGVIMYLRLGWVVGQAGLFATIAIIIVAHIISVSTGLSISSIATDKKIKTGGIYYILSRSLGLPMGGAIGITLFVGTALSIALYIVGFTENFLGIEAISNFLNLDYSINSVRVVGTGVLVFLVVIAFISTSLAIKTQFIVLGAIALSLVSIALGFLYVDTEAIGEIAMAPAPNHLPIITIFAIFFPAVTGFTAGVAMSGDLEDPKRSIPKGTMLAIATGLMVYLLLAIGIAYFVDREVLLTDTNFLVNIALFSPLVIAGIWGATLSSALGGILGAPRLIQAIATDKILPAPLGKGFGPANEPRNALIFTFLIAEIGILIGELDAIAEVVSMFYIAAYGFINLAFALEKWASTDFRPSFSISKWVGIIGFLASFGVMLELNPGAMFAAFVIMWLIYFILKRRELKSDFGDVWGSVWSSLVRTSITRLSEKSLEKRNWKPNILLFSGDPKNRPQLLQIGRQLIGKYGFLSHFDLTITSEEGFKFTKNEQLIDTDEQSKGIFSRRHSVSDLYDGIEQISSTYGFAGVEPNTIFMGWGRNSEHPIRFANMLKNLYSLDLNVVMMDYDKRYGFGDRKQIDVWWRGQGQNGNLALQLVKFLRESEDWSKSQLRLLVVNPVNDEHAKLHRQAKDILSNLRIDGQVRVINNQIENRSFYDIVHVESVNSSLIFMGLPEIADGEEIDFVEKTNDLCHKIGTVILVRSSSHFIELHIGSKTQLPKNIADKTYLDWMNGKAVLAEKSVKLQYPEVKGVKHFLDSFHADLDKIHSEAKQNYLTKISTLEVTVLHEWKKAINHIRIYLQENIKNSTDLNSNKVASAHSRIFKELKLSLDRFKNVAVQDQNVLLGDFITSINEGVNEFYQQRPHKIQLEYSLDQMRSLSTDNLDIKYYKWVNRMKGRMGKRQFTYSLRFKALAIQHFLPHHLAQLESFFTQFGLVSSQNIVALENFVSDLDREFQSLYQMTIKKRDSHDFLQLVNGLDGLIDLITEQQQERIIALFQLWDSLPVLLTNEFSNHLKVVGSNSLLDEEFNANSALSGILNCSVHIPEMQIRNQKLLLNRIDLNTHLLIFSTQLRQFSQLLSRRMKNYLQNDLINNYEVYLKSVKEFQSQLAINSNVKFNEDFGKLQIGFDQAVADNLVNLSLKTHKALMKDLPKDIEIFTEESDSQIGTGGQFDELSSVNLSVIRLIDYIVQDEFTSSLENILSVLPEKVHQVQHQLQDHFRVFKYNVENKLQLKEQFPDYLKSEIESIEKHLVDNQEMMREVLLQIEERQRIIEEKLSLYPFIQTSLNLKQYIKKRELVKKRNPFSKYRYQLGQFFRNKAADLWYRQSQGLLFTRSLLEEHHDEFATQKIQRKAISDLSSNAQVVDKLPFYYKQLFSNRLNFMSEFWVDRPTAELELQSYLTDFGNQLSKAILITGMPGSGKSYLTYKLGSMIEPKRNVYTISPPENGSVDLAVFQRCLLDSIELSNIDDIEENIKPNSLIIFEDTELWWKKTVNGYQVIDFIHELIEQFQHRYLFAVVINSFAMEIISQVRPLTQVYSHFVQLDFLDAHALQKMIWKRHLAGGMKLQLKNKHQDSFHAWDFASLFGKYFQYSKGYPLVAMEAWMQNMTHFDGKLLDIDLPKNFDASVLELMDEHSLWFVQLFLLHKQLDISKIILLTLMEDSEVNSRIFELKRIGIIVEQNNGVFVLNNLIIPYLVQVLKTKKRLS